MWAFECIFPLGNGNTYLRVRGWAGVCVSGGGSEASLDAGSCAGSGGLVPRIYAIVIRCWFEKTRQAANQRRIKLGGCYGKLRWCNIIGREKSEVVRWYYDKTEPMKRSPPARSIDTDLCRRA